MATTKDIERSGIVKDGTTGEMFLPESRRADGSIRKARRVKAGFVPQEEVPVYENKGVQWLKSKSDLPVGLAPDLAEKARAAKDAAARGHNPTIKMKGKKKGETTAGKSTAGKQTTNNKKGQKIMEEDNDAVGDLLASIYGIKVSDEPLKKGDNFRGQGGDSAKKLKNLHKKLKSTQKLEEKINNGEIEQPSKDELDKVARRADLETEIKSLENTLEKT